MVQVTQASRLNSPAKSFFKPKTSKARDSTADEDESQRTADLGETSESGGDTDDSEKAADEELQVGSGKSFSREQVKRGSRR